MVSTSAAHFQLSDTIGYDGKALVNALKCDKSLTAQIDVNVSAVPHDHIGLFHASYKPKGQLMLYCFYDATEKGQIPRKTEQAWYHYISDAMDLLSKRVPKSKKFTFSYTMIIITQSSDSSKKLKPSTSHVPSPTLSNTSLAPPEQSLQQAPLNNTPAIYWESMEAWILFAT